SPAVVDRAADLPELLGDTWERGRIDRDLDRALERAGGPDEVLSCPAVQVDLAALAGASEPALAWRLDLPLHAVSPLRVARDSTPAPAGTPVPTRAER